MKIMMVEGRYKGEIDLSKLDASILPNRIGYVTTVQFLDYNGEIMDFLKEKGKEAFVGKERQIYDTQLLGCDQGAAENMENVDAFLYIGTGKFHPLGVALKTNKEVFCYDPIHAIMSKIDMKEVKKYNDKRKAAYLKFLHAKEIGLLVSMKPGQNNFKKAAELKEQLKDKNCCIFVFDTLDFSQIENFPFIECWVNTACNRILDDYDKFPKPLIDLADLEKKEIPITIKQ